MITSNSQAVLVGVPAAKSNVKHLIRSPRQITVKKPLRPSAKVPDWAKDDSQQSDNENDNLIPKLTQK
jgi:hypothetical protein